MKKKILILECVALVVLGIVLSVFSKDEAYSTINAEVVFTGSELMVFKDDNDNLYSVKALKEEMNPGDRISLEYSGVFDEESENQTIEVVGYTMLNNQRLKTVSDEEGIFKMFYNQAKEYLKNMTLEEKIGQVLLARYDDSQKALQYNVAGYVFYEKDFKDKTEEEVLKMINDLDNNSKTPLLTSTDEEGGKVVRVSSNTNFREFPFKSPKELYDEGGLELVRKDTVEKSKLLSSLLINVNLAPVLDMASASSYIYDRTIGGDKELTSNYAKTVVGASKDSGVSYVLKHFPGYGDNSDTHIGESIDDASLDDIINTNIIPFETGIEAGAEAIMIGHNVLSSIGSEPASLSIGVHNLLKENLGFTGVTITDDLDMGALKDVNNKYYKALKAGNDLLIVTDYEKAFNELKEAYNDGDLTEEEINERALKVIAWKYYKYLLPKATK